MSAWVSRKDQVGPTYVPQKTNAIHFRRKCSPAATVGQGTTSSLSLHSGVSRPQGCWTEIETAGKAGSETGQWREE